LPGNPNYVYPEYLTDIKDDMRDDYKQIDSSIRVITRSCSVAGMTTWVIQARTKYQPPGDWHCPMHTGCLIKVSNDNLGSPEQFGSDLKTGITNQLIHEARERALLYYPAMHHLFRSQN